MAHQGFILIADITGFTSYLSRSELEHAQGTLTDLLQLLIDHAEPPLAVSQLEGDAVMSYGLAEGFFSSQTFLEMVEDTYVDFRRTIELMVLNNSCRCNACANVSSLDLKFFLHFGSFTLQRLGDRDQLLGADVNLIHRLLKNSVREATGTRAYILCTESAVRALDMSAATAGLVRHREEVEDFGEVEVWVKDMHPVFEARRQEQEIVFADEEIVDYVETEIAMSPQLVWDYMNQSEFRDTLIGSDRYEVVGRQNGRIGTGSTFQCYHGDKAIPQVVLEWRPFERILMQMTPPLPGKATQILFDFRLRAVEGGTRVSSTIGRVSGPALKRLLLRALLRLRHRHSQQEMEAFREAIEADLAEREVALPPGQRPDPDSIGAAAADALVETGSGGAAPSDGRE